jgi:Protein of unknown function (DUF2400)
MAKILIMTRVSYATLITRLNMYLRWMIRIDDLGVDFGLWKSISQITAREWFQLVWDVSYTYFNDKYLQKSWRRMEIRLLLN